MCDLLEGKKVELRARWSSQSQKVDHSMKPGLHSHLLHRHASSLIKALARPASGKLENPQVAIVLSCGERAALSRGPH